MGRLEVLHEGVLFRNPEPGIRALCAFLPNLVALSDNEVVCAYRLGQAFYSLDGRIAQLRSLDGGLSWVDEGIVGGPGGDEVAYTWTAPHLSRMGDGTLALVAQRHAATDEQALRFNPRTGGMRPTEIVLRTSTDDGRTWSAPRVLDLGGGPLDAPSAVLQLPDGRWFLAVERWKDWDDDSALHIRGSARLSSDAGRTWGERVDFPSAADTTRMYSHSRYTVLRDGRIAALQWTQSIGGAEDFDLHLVVSDRSGARYDRPRPTGIAAQTSWLADLGSGRMAAAFTVRGGLRPGIAVALSEDGGGTWDVEGALLVWDAVGQEYLGLTRAPAYPASHDTIAFGKPNLVAVPSGELLVAWWCTQACVTHARYARLAVH